MGLFIGWKSGALDTYQTSHVMKTLVFAYAKNKDVDQPANPCSLIIVFVSRCLDRTIYIRNSKPRYLARIFSGADQFKVYLAVTMMINIKRAEMANTKGQMSHIVK